MRKLLSILAVSGVALAPVAHAQEAAVYTPSGPWALDYGEDYCRLGRVFTSGNDQIELGIERIRPAAQVRIWLVGESLRMFRGATEAGYSFLPSQGERTVQPIRAVRGNLQVISLPEVTLTPTAPGGPGGAGGPGAFAPYDPAAERTAAKAITGISVSKGLTRPVRLETGALDAPMQALQSCTDDLVKSWGVDPEKHKALSAPASPQGMPWLPANTIGFADFAKFAGNANQVRLLIDESGKPTKCQIAWPTLDQSVNDTICKSVMEKASFTPAKDAGGQAIASYWMGSPMFLMPGPGGRR